MAFLMVSLAMLSAKAATDLSSTSPFYEDKLNLMFFKDEKGESHAVKTPEDWAIRRSHILANFQRVAGQLPDDSRRVPFDVKVEEETDFPKYVRKKITFGVESGDRLPAYLLMPKDLNGKAPAMLCLHPTGEDGKKIVVGLSQKENRNYAQELAERGYVTIAPDYPGFGDYLIDVYAMGYTSATIKGIWNHMRCIDLLQSLPEVDGNCIGSIGHSLGGHNALFVALFDERVKVAVSSCGFNRFAKYYGGNLTGWSHKGYMPRIASEYGCDPAKMPFDWTELLACLAPRPVFVNAPLRDANFEVTGVYDCLEAAKPVYALLGAADKLVAVHPDCEHDFPLDAREQAYAFIGKAFSRE